MRRLMILTIHQVKLIFVLETWTNNMKYEEDWEFKEDTSEINDVNESKISKGKKEEALISSLLAKTFSLKVPQTVIFSVNTP